MNKKSKTIVGIIIVVVLVALVGFVISEILGAAEQVTFTQFEELLFGTAEEDPVINEIYIDGYNWTGYQVDANGDIIAKYTAVGPEMYSMADYLAYIESSGIVDVESGNYLVNIEFADPNAGSIWSNVMPIFGFILVGVLFWLIMRSAAGGANASMSINKQKAHVQNNLKVRFSDVAGAEEEKEELAEVVEFLKTPRKFASLGARIPSGVLLVGPPGTGKTLFAKAVAGEAGVPFFSVSGSDFVEMYVGVGAKRVRDLFDMAKKNQPCIIFIDEIDAVGRRRGAGLGGGHDEREQTLNQILVQMDGFEANEGIIVIAATNREDILDPALLRPGRFDRRITVNLPDVKGREQILKVHARNKPLASDVNFKTVARITAGFSGAELANLLNEAAILTARAGKNAIGNLELYDAINKVVMGPQKKSRVVTESDKRCTAYHEAGHAVLACLCKYCNPVHEVSIIPRGRAAGYTMTRPETDDNDISYNKLVDDICMALGGRVAEELVIKDVTAGASADIQHVSAIARRMVTQWGMSDKLGPVAYDSDQPVFLGMEYGNQSRNGYSEQTATTIDNEIRRFINDAHIRATKLLKENRAILDNMARVLVEKETIYTEEVAMLMKGASYQEVISFMDEREGTHRENPFIMATRPSKEHVVNLENTNENIDENVDDKAGEKTPNLDENKPENKTENKDE